MTVEREQICLTRCPHRRHLIKDANIYPSKEGRPERRTDRHEASIIQAAAKQKSEMFGTPGKLEGGVEERNVGV